VDIYHITGLVIMFIVFLLLIYVGNKLSNKKTEHEKKISDIELKHDKKIGDIKLEHEKRIGNTRQVSDKDKMEYEKEKGDIKSEYERKFGVLRSQYEQIVGETELEYEQKISECIQQGVDKWTKAELEKQKVIISKSCLRDSEIQLKEWKKEKEKDIRQDAIRRSKSVVGGQITEHLVPYLSEFNYNPKDARFIGSPIDLIVMDGLTDGELKQVVFVEVKTGKSGLTIRERQIRNAIRDQKVVWEQIKIGK